MNIKKNLQVAYQFFNQGKINEALLSLDKILNKFPSHFEALSNKAFIYINQNKLTDAEEILRKIILIDPQKQPLQNLINIYIQQKNWSAADEYNKRLEQIYAGPETFLNKALIYRGSEKYNEALDIYNSLIKKYPDAKDLYVNRGFLLNLMERYTEAIEDYQSALKIDKNHFAAIYNLGITYNNNQQPSEAIPYLKRTVELDKNNVDAWLTLAAAQISSLSVKDAKESIKEAAKIADFTKNPLAASEALFQAGTVEMSLDNYDKALEIFRDLIKKNPNHVEGHYHIGIINLKRKKYEEAIVDGFRWRTRKKTRYGKYDDFDLPEINSETKLLVGAEQGIGDHLILIRLLPFLKDKVKIIKYGSYTKLVKFLKYNFEPDMEIIEQKDLVKREKNKEFVDYVCINLFTVLYYLKDILHLKEMLPILKSDPLLTNNYKKKYSEKNKKLIGLSWSSQVAKIGKRKSYDLKDLVPILKQKEKYSFVNLQYGDVKGQIDELNKTENLEIHYDEDLDYYDDMYSLASLVQSCDMVITSSNVTAHIAGCLGVKTYLLLPKRSGKLWYWTEEEGVAQSSWYPSITIIEQEKDTDWGSAIEKLVEKFKG
jgi:tetratricopeptide (TPR) repeat protein